MSGAEAVVHDFSIELLNHRGVGDSTYRAAVDCVGEQGVIDLVSTLGYFISMSMVLNVAHTPEEPASAIAGLPNLPL